MPIQRPTRGKGRKSKEPSKTEKRIEKENERKATARGKAMDKHLDYFSWADDKGNRYGGSEPKNKASKEALRKLLKKSPKFGGIIKGLSSIASEKKKKKTVPKKSKPKSKK